MFLINILKRINHLKLIWMPMDFVNCCKNVVFLNAWDEYLIEDILSIMTGFKVSEDNVYLHVGCVKVRVDQVSWRWRLDWL